MHHVGVWRVEGRQNEKSQWVSGPRQWGKREGRREEGKETKAGGWTGDIENKGAAVKMKLLFESHATEGRRPRAKQDRTY